MGARLGQAGARPGQAGARPSSLVLTDLGQSNRGTPILKQLDSQSTSLTQEGISICFLQLAEAAEPVPLLPSLPSI